MVLTGYIGAEENAPGELILSPLYIITKKAVVRVFAFFKTVSSRKICASSADLTSFTFGPLSLFGFTESTTCAKNKLLTVKSF
jgi:hypothetical protein